MNTIEEVSILEKKIAERKAILRKFLKFAEGMLTLFGKVLSREQGSFHTNIVKSLETGNFEFKFLGDFGQTEMGGNDIKIFFREKIVLNVYSQTQPFDSETSDIKVWTFVKETDWQESLNKVIEQKDQIVGKILQDKIDEEKKEKVERATNFKFETLKEEAKRLGLDG